MAILSSAMGGLPSRPGILSDDWLAQAQSQLAAPQVNPQTTNIAPVPTEAPAVLAAPAIDQFKAPGALPTGAPDIAAQDRKSASNRKALLALGAGLLGGKNFFDGLSNGITAYQGTLDAEDEANKPKVTALNGGTHLMRTNRDGTYSIEETPVSQFELGKAETAYLGREKLAGMQIKAKSDENDENRAARKEEWQARIASQAAQAEEARQTRLMIAQMGAQSRMDAASARNSGKPMPGNVMKDYLKLDTYVSDAQFTGEQIDSTLSDLQTGKLDLNVASNLRHKAALATGIGANEETVRYSQYQQTLEGLRNTLLMLNTGVQTDGDADRAMAQLVQGNGDSKSVQANLQTVKRSIAKRSGLAQRQMQMLDNQYSGGNMGAPPSTQAPSPRPAAPSAPPAFKWRKVSQ